MTYAPSRPNSAHAKDRTPLTIGPRRPGGKEIRLDRAALFERVWTEPVWKLAKEWGLSDRGLAKACARLRIPLPARGFWAKVQAGQRPRRPSLPEVNRGEAEEILIRGRMILPEIQRDEYRASNDRDRFARCGSPHAVNAGHLQRAGDPRNLKRFIEAGASHRLLSAGESWRLFRSGHRPSCTRST